MNSINQKINKYELKLKENTDPQKEDMYKQKIDYYKSFIMHGGESALLQNAINSQKQLAMDQIESIKKLVESTNIDQQLKELAESSEEVIKKYDALGSDFRTSINNYSDSFKQVSDAIESIKPQDINIEELSDIKNNLKQIPDTIDKLILRSLAMDKSKGIDISDELQKYGISENQVNEVMNELQAANMGINIGPSSTNINSTLTNKGSNSINRGSNSTSTNRSSNSGFMNINLTNSGSNNKGSNSGSSSNSESTNKNSNSDILNNLANKLNFNGSDSDILNNLARELTSKSNSNNKQTGGQMSEYNSFIDRNQYNKNYINSVGGAQTNYNRYSERNDDLGVNADDNINYAPENYGYNRSNQNRARSYNNSNHYGDQMKNGEYTIGNNFNELKSPNYADNNFILMGEKDRESYNTNIGGINDTTTNYNNSNNMMGGYNGNMNSRNNSQFREDNYYTKK